MATIKASAPSTIEIQPIQTQTITVAILGTRPLILNRLAEKARQELLMPKGRKTTAERASSLKHQPLDEFRSAPYIIPDDSAPTLLGFPASAIKGAMMQAALRLPGARKTEIAQLVWVEGDILPVFGKPELFMSVTRSADMNRTPDIRTRVILPEWAAMVSITFTVPLINETSIANLVNAAGQICGIGDWRPEKGKGTFGQFSPVNIEDDAFQDILNAGGRAVQQDAMDNPEPYDMETEELYDWFVSEAKTRGKIAA